MSLTTDLLDAAKAVLNTVGVLRGKDIDDADDHTHEEWAMKELATAVTALESEPPAQTAITYELRKLASQIRTGTLTISFDREPVAAALEQIAFTIDNHAQVLIRGASDAMEAVRNGSMQVGVATQRIEGVVARLQNKMLLPMPDAYQGQHHAGGLMDGKCIVTFTYNDREVGNAAMLAVCDALARRLPQTNDGSVIG